MTCNFVCVCSSIQKRIHGFYDSTHARSRFYCRFYIIFLHFDIQIPLVPEFLRCHGGRHRCRRGQAGRRTGDETLRRTLFVIIWKLVDLDSDPILPPVLCARRRYRKPHAGADASVKVKRAAPTSHINEQAENNWFGYPGPAVVEISHCQTLSHVIIR